jgi:hypothetical protein
LWPSRLVRPCRPFLRPRGDGRQTRRGRRHSHKCDVAEADPSQPVNGRKRKRLALNSRRATFRAGDDSEVEAGVVKKHCRTKHDATPRTHPHEGAARPDTRRRTAILFHGGAASQRSQYPVKILIAASNEMKLVFNEPPKRSGATAQALLLLKLTACRLYEGHKMIRRFPRRAFSRNTKNELSSDALKNLDKLNKYFGSKSLVQHIRTRFAFHSPNPSRWRITTCHLSSGQSNIYQSIPVTSFFVRLKLSVLQLLLLLGEATGS